MKCGKIFMFVLCSLLCKGLHSQNATLTIKNKSDRHLSVKLMRGPEKKAVLYKADSIVPKGTLVFDITETGLYFTKLQAILYDKKNPGNNDTLYSKDRPFQVIADKKRGYSNITIEFRVKESRNESSVAITRKEYEK